MGISLNLGDAYALLTAVCWAVAVIFFRLAGNHFRAVPLKMLHNVLVTALFGLSTLIFVGWHVPDFTATEWLRLSLSAVVGVTIADTTHIAVIRRLGASGGALVDTLYLPLIMIMAFYFYGETLGPKELFGGFLVLVGIGLGSFEPSRILITRKDLLVGLGLGIITQMGHAGTVMLIKDLLAKESVLLLSFFRFSLGSALLFLIYSRRSNLKMLFEAFSFDRRMLVTIPGAFLGLFLSTFLWFLGFKYTLAGRAAIYNQLATVFIIILAATFLKEELSLRRVLAVALALSGSFIVAMA